MPFDGLATKYKPGWKDWLRACKCEWEDGISIVLIISGVIAAVGFLFVAALSTLIVDWPATFIIGAVSALLIFIIAFVLIMLDAVKYRLRRGF